MRHKSNAVPPARRGAATGSGCAAAGSWTIGSSICASLPPASKKLAIAAETSP